MTDNSVVTSDLWYRYDMGWNALASYDLGTDGSTAWDIGTRAQSVAYLGMTPLAEAPGANPSTAAYRHYLHDHLGSTRALYDGTKQHRARIAYTPYGEQTPSTAGTTPTYTFTGKQWEPETGLYFFPYRYYAPTAARWAWRDPLGMVDGPNVYGYVGAAPTLQIDELGLATRDECEKQYDKHSKVCRKIRVKRLRALCWAAAATAYAACIATCD